MEAPRIVAVAPGSPAAAAGLAPGDVLSTINDERPRDVIRYQHLVDEAHLWLEVDRGGLTRMVEIDKGAGEPLGIEVHAPLFDEVQTCDNHCGFCFIYQLPKGMRRSLYLKDDDYRLSFLYGNFTTLTRFTEADLERVITEGLSPLYVSIHATDPERRAAMLRNRRGATSLRWLRALLDHGVEVHGQIVVCPGVNDGEVLDDTLAGILDRYPELATVAVVPLGVSDHSDEPDMRPHTVAEAVAVVELVEGWQSLYLETLGRRLVYAADEYYLLAGREFPEADSYDGFAMHEDGIGMARTFEAEFLGLVDEATGPAAGFFASVEGAPAVGYRAPRMADGSGCGTGGSSGEQASTVTPVALSTGPRSAPETQGQPAVGPTSGERSVPIGILTGAYGARVLEPLIDALERDDIRVIAVANDFFGGNIAVTGLMTGSDVSATLAAEPDGHRYLLPDVCLSGGRFLDGVEVGELPRPVEVVPTDGIALRRALGLSDEPTEVQTGSAGAPALAGAVSGGAS